MTIPYDDVDDTNNQTSMMRYNVMDTNSKQ